MTRKKKSGFLTFCFSLLPGAGEMYLGFMKMGISLMGLFFGLIALSSILNVGTLMLIDAVLWFYSFFHVHNLAGMSDSEYMNTKDVFLFNLDVFFDSDKNHVEKYRKVIAVILIIAGILLLWGGMKMLVISYLPDVILRLISRLERTIPRMLAGIGIIIGGFYMIKGKKEELRETITMDAAERDEGAAVQNKGAAVQDKGAAVQNEGAAVQDKGAAVQEEGAAVQEKGTAVQEEGTAVQEEGTVAAGGDADGRETDSQDA